MVTSDSSPARRRRVTGTVVLWVLGALLLLTIAATGWIGARGYLAYQHLTSAQDAADDLLPAVADPAAAGALLQEISSDTAAAHSLTDDLVWKLGEQLPWVGPQLAAVSTVAASLDHVATTALAPVADLAASFSIESLRPQNGSIDLAPFAELADATAAIDGLEDAVDAVADIDPAPLVAPVREAVADVTAVLQRAHTAADALQRTATLLPAMLGAEGPRNYLLVFQNNAEWRSLGGIIGAMVLVHTDKGSLSLTAQGSSSDFPRYDEPVVPLSDDEVRLFGRQPALFVQNVTQIPDFTRDGPIAREMWLRETGTDIDGVIALDPVALSYLLRATGPIELPTGDVLTSDNAVQLLLNEVYLRYRIPAEQDAFFALASSAVFDRLTAGDLDPVALIDALAQSGTERRLMIWSVRPEDQAMLDDTTLQGIPDAGDPDTTAFGVFANDATSSKMNYYTALQTSAAWCGAEAALDVRIANNAPADAANLPPYITGAGSQGVPPGEVETVTYIYLPPEASLVSTETSGEGFSPGFSGGSDSGRQVVSWTTRLAPGQELTLRLRVHTPRTDRIVIQTTPTVHAGVDADLALACDVPG